MLGGSNRTRMLSSVRLLLVRATNKRFGVRGSLIEVDCWIVRKEWGEKIDESWDYISTPGTLLEYRYL